MNKLVVHHIYANGMAFDTSGYRNHGVPYDVTQAAPPLAPAFTYTQGDSRVIVPPSASLDDLLAVRAVVSFYLDPPGGLTHRYNLVEGHLAFALFVNPDGSLQGTIVDASQEWAGAQTAPGVVSAAQWHTAELRHDGINQCALYLDGAPVATSYVAAGPVGSVGPNGIAVGHWPEPSGVYTFSGSIREFWLYKYDPTDAARGLLDPCCSCSGKALDDMLQTLRAKGYSGSDARAQGMAIIKQALSLTAAVRGTDPAGSQANAALCAQALTAFNKGDSAGYTDAMAQLAAMAASALSPGDQQQFSAEISQLVSDLPLPLKDFQALLKNMCLGGPQLNAGTILNTVGQSQGGQGGQGGAGGSGGSGGSGGPGGPGGGTGPGGPGGGTGPGGPGGGTGGQGGGTGPGGPGGGTGGQGGGTGPGGPGGTGGQGGGTGPGGPGGTGGQGGHCDGPDGPDHHDDDDHDDHDDHDDDDIDRRRAGEHE